MELKLNLKVLPLNGNNSLEKSHKEYLIIPLSFAL